MEYNVEKDIKAVREMLGITQAELAADLHVEQATISRNEQGITAPSAKLLENFYEYAFHKDIRLNRLKEMLWAERISQGHRLLFHGAKSNITGDIQVSRARGNNDFGKGFYTGESYEQAVSFVSGFENSCVYYFDFNPDGLKSREYYVDQEWMMTIAYYRGGLEEYKDHPIVKKLAANTRECDYIIAPIADNRMFQIINSFVFGEITDEQCKHCLAATNLGKQFVFISEKSVNNLKMIERCYISEDEKKYYRKVRASEAKLEDDKVKLARIQYRGQGRYIDQILE